MDRAVAEQRAGRLHRAPAARRGRRRGDAGPRGTPQVLRHAPGRGHRRPAQPGAGTIAARPRSASTCPTPGPGGCEELRDAHPLVGRAARVAQGGADRDHLRLRAGWIEHLGADERLRGAWTGSDGAAGRMTASAGCTTCPPRCARRCWPADGHLFVRADLGQIEPRVLAAVSGDPALTAATRADDLYAPVAAQLGVDRPTAKVAVLGAMYGQTTGHGAQALRRLERGRYPVAMAYLDSADRAGQAGRDLRTYGGRLIRMLAAPPPSPEQQPGRGLRPVRAQRDGPGAAAGAVQDVGGHGPGPVRRRSARGSCSACTTSCLCTSPRSTAEQAAELVGDCLAETARALGAGAAGPVHRRYQRPSAAGPTRNG